VPLAALITAQDQTDIGDGLRATLPLAGRTLLEYQAGLALAAGAGHVVILAERVPAPLASAIDRLRRGGARIEIARTVPDAIDRFHPQERILLLADGAVAAQGAIDALAATPAAALLVLPDTPDYLAFERIDATQRWAGCALLGKPQLEATARMLGDWDLTSTLLRRLVQADAMRVDALDPSGDRPLPPPVLATGPAAIGAVEASLLRRAEADEGNWTERHLHRLFAAPLIPPLIERQVEPARLAYGAVALGWAAPLLASFHYYWAALLLLPIAAGLASTARRMGRIWGGGAGQDQLCALARHAASSMALILLCRTIAAEGGWGWWTIAALIAVGLAGTAGLAPVVAAIRPLPDPRWLASADALLWTAPVLAFAGGWRWMLALLAAYVAISFVERFVAAWQGARIRGR